MIDLEKRKKYRECKICADFISGLAGFMYANPLILLGLLDEYLWSVEETDMIRDILEKQLEKSSICSCTPPHCRHEDNCALYGEGDTPD